MNAKRIIGILAHIDAGKTTLTERILYYAGKIRSIGEVHDGKAEMDWMELEKERGVSITSAATACLWKGVQVQIIDTPGHVDFTAEVERSLRVLDGAIGVFCAVAGVQSQSEAVWRQADKYRTPRLVFVNKMDRSGAVFERVIEDLRNRLSERVLPFQIPIGSEQDFQGVVDLIRLKAWTWKGDSWGADFEETIPENDLLHRALDQRRQLVESLADWDNDFAVSYLEYPDRFQSAVGTGSFERGVRDIMESASRLVRSCALFPVFCGSAFRNKAVQPLLDAVLDYFPDPQDQLFQEATSIDGSEKVSLRLGTDQPFLGIAFKVQNDVFVERLVYVRVYSGVLRSGVQVWNTNTGKSERVLGLLRMHANDRETLREAFQGDIVAIVGLKSTTTGDTLCDKKRIALLENIRFSEPVVSFSIEPRSRAESDALEAGLRRMLDEDPTLRLVNNKETGQTLIAGMGEFHLEIVRERLSREYGVHAIIGKPEVAYRETATRATTAEGFFDREMNGVRYFAGAEIKLEPIERGSGVITKISFSERCPTSYRLACQKGMETALLNGTICGFPVTDVFVEVLRLEFEEISSSPLAAEVACTMACRNGFIQSKPVILEPIMRLEVFLPEEHLGSLFSLVTNKMGRIETVEDIAGGKVVNALVPLRSFFGFTSELRSLTKGRATSTMQLSHFSETPHAVQVELVRRVRGCVQ